jgi:superoxide dismutase, Fe-Mn family
MAALRTSLASLIGMFFLAGAELAQPFTLAPLPYASDALEPVIDQQTMDIHHGRHHRAYVNNLNAQIENYPELAGMSLVDMMGQISRFNAAVRNNGGGHYNHDLFWQLMAPQGNGGEPAAGLLTAIERDFGSFETMQAEFARAAGTRFGSGWAWLIVTDDKKLAVTSTANQDNPLMDVVAERGTPILALDVWEHAYYLSYQNRRGAYLQHWWTIVNWNEVNRLYALATR